METITWMVRAWESLSHLYEVVELAPACRKDKDAVKIYQLPGATAERSDGTHHKLSSNYAFHDISYYLPVRRLMWRLTSEAL